MCTQYFPLIFSAQRLAASRHIPDIEETVQGLCSKSSQTSARVEPANYTLQNPLVEGPQLARSLNVGTASDFLSAFDKGKGVRNTATTTTKTLTAVLDFVQDEQHLVLAP